MPACPFSHAIISGVVSGKSVRPWSMLALDSTRIWTASSWPFLAAMKRAVAPLCVSPWSVLAPN